MSLHLAEEWYLRSRKVIAPPLINHLESLACPKPPPSAARTNPFDRIADRSFRVGIIGLGYVGLPLARTFARNGFSCTGFDIDPGKIEKLNGGVSYIRHLDAKVFSDFIADGRFTPTTDFSRIDAVDACIICVPTPLNRYREPDLSYVVQTCETIAQHLRPGQLVVLEFDHLSRHHHGGGAADPRARRPQSRDRFLPRLLARARGPGQRILRDGDHPKGGRRATTPNRSPWRAPSTRRW